MTTPDERTLLERYRLVGGPEEMIPRLKRVAARLKDDAAVREEYERETYALFEKTPGENIEKWPGVQGLGEDTGAFNMAVALASVPLVAETHRRFGLPPEHLAHTFSWFRAMIDLYARRHGGATGITHTRTFWFRKHADGLLFRFGNMEFLRGPCPDYIPADFRAALASEDEVPTFHFPGGPDGLAQAKIKAAFAEACDFWKRAFGRYPKAFACDSWLFNEHWPELIPNTKIAHSIDLFERLQSLPYNADEPSGLFFVYDLERCDPRDYPVTNSLERAFVTLFDRGIPLQDGCAWVKVDEAGRVLWKV